MEQIKRAVGAVVAQAKLEEGAAPEPRRCGFPDFIVGERPSGEVCDGAWHSAPLAAGGVETVRRCPAVAADEIAGRVAAERQRLAGALRLLCRRGGEGFDGYDPGRAVGARKALAAMRAFAGERRPAVGVLLSGTTGVGKTRLLLASHFARLAAGYPSEYVTAGELRPAFKALLSFDEAAVEEAQARVRALQRAAALHLDDLGDVTGSPAFHSGFQVGFKMLLDGFGGGLAVAMNLDGAGARSHPDVGDRILSRLRDLADPVRVEGEDQRVAGLR